ncbi:MAG TPA: hypothetical protein VM032_04055 [Vicinamibacterales bacterium]|nr:hypothetical protein [Vicinamibacterales bacterium]
MARHDLHAFRRRRVAFRGVRVLACVATFLVCFAARVPAARAADGEPGAPQTQGVPPPPAPSAADFLFGAPRAWLSLRGSLLFPRAGGDLFAFVSDQLTVDKTDLRARGFAADVGAVLTPSVDLVVGFDLTRRDTGSEYRRFVASNAQPITQFTRLQQSALSVGVRATPFGRGRRISRYAFIPKRVVPYGGAGLAISHYDFSQRGQFVDFADLSIFNDRFVSNGWSVGPYVHGGADVQVWKRLSLTFDGRYTWLHSGLDADFSGFDGIDLAGFRGGTGISVVF